MVDERDPYIRITKEKGEKVQFEAIGSPAIIIAWGFFIAIAGASEIGKYVYRKYFKKDETKELPGKESSES